MALRLQELRDSPSNCLWPRWFRLWVLCDPGIKRSKLLIMKAYPHKRALPRRFRAAPNVCVIPKCHHHSLVLTQIGQAGRLDRGHCDTKTST